MIYQSIRISRILVLASALIDYRIPCIFRELGIGVVPFSPLGRGFFAGYKPDVAPEHDARKVRISYHCQY